MCECVYVYMSEVMFMYVHMHLCVVCMGVYVKGNEDEKVEESKYLVTFRADFYFKLSRFFRFIQ